MNRAGWRTGALLGALSVWAGVAGWGQAAPAAALAVLHVAEGPQQVRLTGRDGSTIFYSMPNAPAGVQAGVELDRIRAAEFAVQYDGDELMRAVMAGDARRAGGLLLAALQAYLPYLDLPANNAVEPALECAQYLATAARESPTAEDAARLWRHAAQVFDAAAKARWYPMAEQADARVVQCLIGLGQLEEARQRLDALREPDIWDGAYGVYWLAQAEWLQAGEAYHAALDAAVKSVVFQNKDVGSFPDALLLSARCYEAVSEPHRARDVYYEIARLFPNTYWARTAVAALRRLLAAGLTDTPEEQALETVFFGMDEDMNATVRDFLATLDAQKPEVKEQPNHEP